MTTYKSLICACLLVMTSMVASAQNSVNSPYTRYGFGQLSDQNFGHSQAMGGIAYGLRNGMQVNATNPASYSAVDSLTFIFDAGMSLQNTNFKEGNVSTNAKNSSIDYIAAQFRLRKGLGFTIGLLPYSTVGYSMVKNPSKINEDESAYNSFNGEGGLQQVFVGLGWKAFKGLSVGANLSYLYGDITHSVTATFSNSNAYSSVRVEQISISSYKLDMGVQYSLQLKKNHMLNLGAVYSLGHDVNGDFSYYQYTSNTSNPEPDILENAFSIPHTFGIGATYVYDNRLTVGLDYTLQKWADVKYPERQPDYTYISSTGQFEDRTKVAVGAEFLPSRQSNKYLNNVRYRVGAYYSSPYTKINGEDGNREYGVSFGFGLPLYKTKTILNLSGQYIKVSPKVKGMLEESYLRINIGLTFNERWFMKWKVD